MQTTADIRAQLKAEYARLGADAPMIDLVGVSFLADAPAVIGTPNYEYIGREIEWYESESLNIADFPGGAPKIWKRCANGNGRVNSNYGWMLYSDANGRQYEHVIDELVNDHDSRRAVAVYTRPSIHREQFLDPGHNVRAGQDFICTNAVHYRLTGEALTVVVQMRSNDAVFGYRNDYAWQEYAAEGILAELVLRTGKNLYLGDIIWQAASFHVYPRHYHLLEGE